MHFPVQAMHCAKFPDRVNHDGYLSQVDRVLLRDRIRTAHIVFQAPEHFCPVDGRSSRLPGPHLVGKPEYI
jgi:hypothetical protein